MRANDFVHTYAPTRTRAHAHTRVSICVCHVGCVSACVYRPFEYKHVDVGMCVHCSRNFLHTQIYGVHQWYLLFTPIEQVPHKENFGPYKGNRIKAIIVILLSTL